MTKILLYGSALSNNLGGPSLFITTCKVLKQFIPDAKFIFKPQSRESNPRQAKRYEQKYNVEKIQNIRTKEIYIGFLLSIVVSFLNYSKIKPPKLLFRNKWLKQVKNVDMIIDVRGISQTDYFSNWITPFKENIVLITGAFLNKLTIKYTQDMGPFRNISNRIAAKFFLNRYSLIFSRGEKTKKLLIGIGIKTPIYILPDTAFIMEPPHSEEMRKIVLKEGLSNKPLIGIVASRRIDKRILNGRDRNLQNNYTLLLAQIADYMIEKYNVDVVLIPNEISRKVGGYDDIFVCKKIYSKVYHKDKLKIITKNYNAEQIKGIIGNFDLLISSRYHSPVVAGYSMGVLTIII